jgi:uncharacterized protein (TIGR02284 family)
MDFSNSSNSQFFIRYFLLFLETNFPHTRISLFEFDLCLAMSTLSTLHNLIHILKDGQEGFRTASEDISNSELKTLFSSYSLQRSKFSGELQALAHELGEQDPPSSGSVAGALHRGWIDLKAALMSRDEHAVLAECERGEDAAVAAYRKAIEEDDLPANILSILQIQFMDIKSAHDNIRNLRDSRKAA